MTAPQEIPQHMGSQSQGIGSKGRIWCGLGARLRFVGRPGHIFESGFAAKRWPKLKESSF
jgi:hypothetical protein